MSTIAERIQAMYQQHTARQDKIPTAWELLKRAFYDLERTEPRALRVLEDANLVTITSVFSESEETILLNSGKGSIVVTCYCKEESTGRALVCAQRYYKIVVRDNSARFFENGGGSESRIVRSPQEMAESALELLLKYS